MILIYTPKITNRIRYIFDVIFKDMLGIEHQISTDSDTFINFNGPKINYSQKAFNTEIFFCASPLLFERGIKDQPIKVEKYKHTYVFFINRSNSHLPFDIFAASFYLITRYEEYSALNPKTDQHGRFIAEQSIAFKNGFLQQPIIDIWLLFLQNILTSLYPNLNIAKQKYKFIPTYDIDSAYQYANKGILRNFGGYIADLKRKNWAALKQRTAVILGTKPDAFDTYNWQMQLKNIHNLSPIYFFLVGNYNEYDKNISTEKQAYLTLIQNIADSCEVGIHPSYASNNNPNLIATEVERLQNILKKDVFRSRQHFIKLNIPNTYQNLIELDLLKDYSMGYPSQIGFRAGTASSFYFYDLKLEIKTPLKVYPFAIMDVTLKNYMQLSPETAINKSKKIIDEIKAVNGLFITLWHNDTISNTPPWNGWQTVYQQIIAYATQKQSRLL